MDELKKAYLLLQENCGIKVGDTVKVLRKAETDEGGWDNSWIQSMDEFIGKYCKVSDINDTGIYLVCDSVEWSKRGFPFFVLEKVAHEVTSLAGETVADTAISLRDQFASAALTGNLQFFADHDVTDFREIAEDCYNLADAMLKAREE